MENDDAIWCYVFWQKGMEAHHMILFFKKWTCSWSITCELCTKQMRSSCRWGHPVLTTQSCSSQLWWSFCRWVVWGYWWYYGRVNFEVWVLIHKRMIKHMQSHSGLRADEDTLFWPLRAAVAGSDEVFAGELSEATDDSMGVYMLTCETCLKHVKAIAVCVPMRTPCFDHSELQ